MKNTNTPAGEFHSFAELRQAYGFAPVVKQTKDSEKLSKQREDFCKRHLCRGCGKPMSYIGGNTMACKNEDCKGIKDERVDREGNTVVRYYTSYDILDELGAEIAANIFAE